MAEDNIFYIVTDEYIAYLSKYKINDEGDFSYKMLMLAEYSFCKDNREKIEKTARNLVESH